MSVNFFDLFDQVPLIGIFRGVKPDEAQEVVGAAVEQGIRLVEIPLNSPDPFVSISRLAKVFAGQALVGAGTVTTVAEVDAVAAAGGQLIVTPFARPDVTLRAKERGLIAAPGALTPTEIALMHDCGADVVKIFPADMLPPASLKGVLAPLPAGIRLLPVGGVGLDNMAAYLAAGAAGFGLGSALYRKGDSAAAVAQKAKEFVAEITSLRN